MPRILLTTCCPDWPLIRQTPGRLGRWEDFEFTFRHHNDADCLDEGFDAWVVLENPTQLVTAKCNANNTFFISWEPPEICSYGKLFLNQFRWVQTCHESSHPGLIRSQQSQPWHVGVNVDENFRTMMDYDDFDTMKPLPKTRLISAAISSKAITPAHRQRLDFVKRLRSVLGDQFHLLGRGHQPFSDKWQAVSPYRFHMVLENASHPHYLTEKLSDAFLGNSFPFYYGAANATEYFPSGSFQPIDIFDPDRAIEIILRSIDDRLDEKRQSELNAARRIVLDQLNTFPMMVKLLRQRMVSGPQIWRTIYPKNHHAKLAISSFQRAIRFAA